MTNINFDYELPSGTTINVEAEIVSEGTAPTFNARPDQSDEGESPEIEIVDCYVCNTVTETEIDLTGLWFRKYKSTTMVEVTEHIKDLAWAKYEEGK